MDLPSFLHPALLLQLLPLLSSFLVVLGLVPLPLLCLLSNLLLCLCEGKKLPHLSFLADSLGVFGDGDDGLTWPVLKAKFHLLLVEAPSGLKEYQVGPLDGGHGTSLGEPTLKVGLAELVKGANLSVGGLLLVLLEEQGWWWSGLPGQLWCWHRCVRGVLWEQLVLLWLWCHGDLLSDSHCVGRGCQV